MQFLPSFKLRNQNCYIDLNIFFLNNGNLIINWFRLSFTHTIPERLTLQSEKKKKKKKKKNESKGALSTNQIYITLSLMKIIINRFSFTYMRWICGLHLTKGGKLRDTFIFFYFITLYIIMSMQICFGNCFYTFWASKEWVSFIIGASLRVTV